VKTRYLFLGLGEVPGTCVNVEIQSSPKRIALRVEFIVAASLDHSKMVPKAFAVLIFDSTAAEGAVRVLVIDRDFFGEYIFICFD
jgi:hypothetical protein